MMMGKLRCWLTLLFAIQAMTGCGYLKSLFPDKERDYQFRTEIPELIVPEDLKNRTLPDRTPATTPVAASAAAEAEQTAPAAPQEMPDSASRKQPEEEATGEDRPVVQVSVSKAAVSSLQIDQPQKMSWRLVARALSRQKIEIVERNLDKGYFYVKYDPDEIKPEDSTFLDEMTFLFGEDPSHEVEYRISLLEIAPQATEVTVQDSQGKTLSNRPATHLLKLITDGINQDLPKNTPETTDNVPAP